MSPLKSVATVATSIATASVDTARSYFQQKFGTPATNVDREKFETEFAEKTRALKLTYLRRIAFVNADFRPTPEEAEILKRGGITEAALVQEATDARNDRVAELILAGVGHEEAFAKFLPLHKRVRELTQAGHQPDSPALLAAQKEANAAHKAQRLLAGPRTLGLAYLRLPYESDIRAQQRTIATAEDKLNELGASIQRASAVVADGAVPHAARLEALAGIDDMNQKMPRWEHKRSASLAKIEKIEAEQAAAEKAALADADKRAAAAAKTAAKTSKPAKSGKAGL